MSWQSLYEVADSTLWEGRRDIPPNSCFYQQIHLVNLERELPKKSAINTFAILGFKRDEKDLPEEARNASYDGPDIIRRKLAKLPIQKSNIVCYDVGNVICKDHDLEKAQESLSDVVDILLESKIRPIIIGGGHELTLGHYRGIVKRFHRLKRLGIINIDAHFELYSFHANNLWSARTAFHQIAFDHKKHKKHLDYNCIGIQHAANIRQSFDTAKKFKTNVILADEMHQGLLEKCFDFVDRVVDENEIIYLSLSLDVFASAFAPGVASPQPLGLYPWHVIPLLRQLAASGKVVSYDIAEYAPRYDIDDCTAKLAATLIYEIIHHHNENVKYQL